MAAREEFHSLTNHPRPHFGGGIAKISWSTGAILDYLREQKLAENTLVVFTSDNGGATGAGSSNRILRESKGRIYEGGVRVPFIAWWPGKIKPGTTCHAPAFVLDFYHTFASLANYRINDDVIRDGIDISDYFFNPGATRDVSDDHPDVVGQILAMAEKQRSALGQYNEQGPEVRKTISVESPRRLIETN